MAKRYSSKLLWKNADGGACQMISLDISEGVIKITSSISLR